MHLSKVEVLRAACCIAGIDGNVEPAERKLIEKLAHDVGVGRMSLDAMLEQARTDCSFFEEQFEVLKADPDQAMITLCGVAIADGQLSSEERILLQHFAGRLGMPEATFGKLMARAEQYVANRKK